MTPNQGSSSRPSNSVGRSTTSNGTATTTQDDERKAMAVADIKDLILLEVEEYHNGRKTLEEVGDKILKVVREEKYCKPPLSVVFTCFMVVATDNASSNNIRILPKFGHVLAYCLHKKEKENGRDDILTGVELYCARVTGVEAQLLVEIPSMWTIVGEILSNAILPTPGLLKGAPATLKDFRVAFYYAAKDNRKPITLFIQVLKRLEEIHCASNKGKYYSDAARKIYRKMTYWVAITANREDLKSITKEMNVKKLGVVLKGTKTNFNLDLYTILNESGCL